MQTSNRDIRYEPEMEKSVCDFVIEQTAKYKGVNPSQLPRLYEYIDPDIMNRVLGQHRDKGTQMEEGHLYFTWEDVTITLYHDGRVLIDNQN